MFNEQNDFEPSNKFAKRPSENTQHQLRQRIFKFPLHLIKD